MKKFSFILLVLLLMAGAVQAAAPLTYEKGTVLSIMPLDDTLKQSPIAEKVQMVNIRLNSGPHKGETITTVHHIPLKTVFAALDVEAGDRVLLAATEGDPPTYNIDDYERMPYVYVLLAVFALCMVLFGRTTGIKSLVVVLISCLLIFKVFISLVLAWHSHIILLVFLVCAVISLITQTFVSGWSRKTRAAILGSIGGVAIAGCLAGLSIHYMHLTGLESEEAMMLKATALPDFDFQEILYAGMMLGALGAVMDVTISISSSVNEIRDCMEEASFKVLFKAGMNVGRDIMGTMSNTLILAYAGSSLPLILLISAQKDMSSDKIMNLNLIVTEITRALTGSIGLICSIPLTAFFAALLFQTREINRPPKRLLRKRKMMKH